MRLPAISLPIPMERALIVAIARIVAVVAIMVPLGIHGPAPE